MKSNIFQNKKVRRFFSVALVLIAIALFVFILISGRRYFSRRSLRQMQRLITSYGFWSPLAVISLIFLSTVIPPLPLPVPLIEIAAGLIFGFWQGFILVWTSQVFSSLAAFGMTRFIGKRFFRSILDNHVFHWYKQYIDKRGPIAVLMTRTTMAAPFNIISFMAGITQMSFISFFIATIIGTVLESALFTFIGAILQHTKLSLWYVFLLVVALGAAGPILMYGIMKTLQPNLQRASRERIKFPNDK